jgi:hypothetical protein
MTKRTTKQTKSIAAKDLKPSRAYNADARKMLVDIFQRSIEAVEMGLVEDAGDLGLIAKVLIELACELDIDEAQTVNEFLDSTSKGSVGATYDYVVSGLFGHYWIAQHSQ